MKDLKITVNIIDLQEYIETLNGLCETAEEVFQEFGVVAKTYVYAIGEGSDYFYRTCVPVLHKDVETALNTATHTIIQLCAEHIY